MDDLISKQAAIELIHSLYPSSPIMRKNRERWKEKYGPYIEIEKALELLPSAQPEPLSDAYTKAVWTWLLDYQIKAAELKGRYTPYEVLSWVVNDWRKEHEGSD